MIDQARLVTLPQGSRDGFVDGEIPGWNGSRRIAIDQTKACRSA